MSKPSTELLDRPRSMDPGVLGTSIEEFTRHLAALGHTSLTVSGYQDGAAISPSGCAERALLRTVSMKASSCGFRSMSADAPATGDIVNFPPST